MQNDILTLTEKLISVSSTKENPKALEEALVISKKYLKGYETKVFKNKGFPSIIYYNTPKLPKRFKVILNAHLDVVPGNNTQYKAAIRGDKLYGRGACDMKAAAAVEILVFKELASKVKYSLGLQLVTDEEIGGFNGTEYQVKKGVRADFVITGERSDLDIDNMSKGVIWLKLKSFGKTAHGAYLWNGKNALTKLNLVLNKIWKIYPIPKKEVWKTTVNVGNVLTENQTFKKVTNRKVKICKTHGANDIRHFNKFGCNGIEFGPVGIGLHTDNEWVSIKSLESYYQILKDFLLSL